MIETEFRKHLLVRIGACAGYRVWAQNCGKIPIRDGHGKIVRVFDAGPQPGASDISGIVCPEGWRIEFELKGPKTPVIEAQMNWEARMVEYGAVYVRYRYNTRYSLEENLDRAAYELDVAIELKRSGQIVSADCARPSCKIVKQV